MPRIKKQVNDFFKDCPGTKISTDARMSAPVTAVATGAAFYGMTFSPQEHDGTYDQVTLTDITTKSLGLKVTGNKKGLICSMVRKGEFLPFQHSVSVTQCATHRSGME